VTRLRILLTRPEPDAERTAARLARLGHHVLIDSLLTIEPVAIDKLPAGPFAAVAATSANALRNAGGRGRFDSLRSVPLYAVGGHTGEAAREAGFASVVVAEGDAAALARLLSERIKPSSRVLHLAGEERAQDLKALLAPAGIAVETVVLYRMRPADNLSVATVAALASAKLDAVLHYSPRSAASFIALAQKQNLIGAMRNLRHLCLSEAVAAPLTAIGVKVEIAARPEETALIDLLES
jgi:uroporphyrinogen-III synthase